MNLTVHVDGGSRGNPGPAAAGVLIADAASGSPLHEAGYFLGRATNNVAEYEGLVRALHLITAAGAGEVCIYSDSELMVNQITGTYRVKSADLLPLYERALMLLLKLDLWQIRHVPREKNTRADQLANMALDAGKDVVVRKLGRLVCETADPVDQGISTAVPLIEVPAKLAAPASSFPQWKATFETAGGESCPGSCRAGRVYVLGAKLPQGLCLFAAQAILDELPLHHLDDEFTPVKVDCPRCGAVIHLTAKE